jgi:predicted DNA binding CopG/RHH family protein
VRKIKTKETSGVKRVNINVPTGLHNSFKAAAAAQGLEMTEVLMAFIESYVAKHGYTTPQKKGRRV